VLQTSAQHQLKKEEVHWLRDLIILDDHIFNIFKSLFITKFCIDFVTFFLFSLEDSFSDFLELNIVVELTLCNANSSSI